MFEKLKKLLTLFFNGNSLDYICGTEALPLPFSQEEESDKISRLESGDEKAKAALVEHNLRLVAHIVKKDYCKGLIRPAENGLKPAAPVSDRSLNGFAGHYFAPALQYDPESSPQPRSEPHL